MVIKEIEINRIKPYKKNPRKIKDAVEPVMQSIRQFGFKQPIVVDSNHVIIIGHVRYEAAKKLGLKTVPCVVETSLTDDEVRSLRLVDNRTREYSRWDYGKLSEELDAIIRGGEIDMLQYGFVIPDEEVKPNEIGQKGNDVSHEPVDSGKEDLAGISGETGGEERSQFICPECGYEFSGGVYLSF